MLRQISNMPINATTVFLLLLLFRPTRAQPDPSASVTIDQLPDYSYQRQCGKGCIQNNYDIGVDIEGELGCTWNKCYCGYTAEATSIIVSCWSAYCGRTASKDTPDVQTALSLYNAYCGIDVQAVASPATSSTPFASATTTAVSTYGGGTGMTTVYVTRYSSLSTCIFKL